MSEQKRIQLRRTKGWRKPDGAIVVGRPSKWGNPFRVGDGFVLSREPQCDPETNNGRVISPADLEISSFVDTPEIAVALYRAWLVMEEDDVRAELAGHDLACWCPLDQPCHADVLLAIANSVGGERW